jgi:hypothetical protein
VTSWARKLEDADKPWGSLSLYQEGGSVASTRLRDPGTGRFISAEPAPQMSVPTASTVVTEPAPAPKKGKKKQDKGPEKKRSPKNKNKNKKKNKKKKKKKG